MTPKEIRHSRIVYLRTMAKRGCKLEELKARCVKWGVAKGTMVSYLDEVRESLLKRRETKK